MSDFLRSCSWDLRESFLYLACCYACPRDFVYYLVEFSPLYLSGSGSCFENRSSVSTVNVGVDYSSHLNDGCAAGVLELAVPQGVMGNGNSGHPGRGFHH